MANRTSWRRYRRVGAGVLVGLVLLVGWMRRAPPSSSDTTGTATPAPAVATCLRAGQPVPVGPTDERALHHVLDRLGYGPSPGDLDQLRQIGVAEHIARQLYPDQIPDRSLATRLAAFDTQRLSTAELVEQFYLPAMQERRRDRLMPRTVADVLSQDIARGPGPPGVRTSQTERLALQELSQQTLLRAIESERQLQEVLVNFWFNHFNVSAGKGLVWLYLTEYERDVIRPHVLGRFRDMLGAVAESPAMLVYLDNWLSSDPDGPDPVAVARDRELGPLSRAVQGLRAFVAGPRSALPERLRRAIRSRARSPGLNENYARELMELHTLGVDGGYTQADVVEVARAFTGWTIDRPAEGGGFVFEPRLHAGGDKIVVGQVIPAGGKSEGDRVLDLLARHPATARLIATKLARRFVSDDPPASVVDRAATCYLGTDGDLREVVRTIITSAEFLDPRVHRVKIKTPLEYVVSAVRAVGAKVADTRALVRALRQLGMPLYFSQPPTGYPDRVDAWLNPGSLLGRMNFALALVDNQLAGVTVPVAEAASVDPAPGSPPGAGAARALAAPAFQMR